MIIYQNATQRNENRIRRSKCILSVENEKNLLVYLIIRVNDKSKVMIIKTSFFCHESFLFHPCQIINDVTFNIF